MSILPLVISDVTPLQITDRVSEAQMMFSKLTYSHIPVLKGDIYLGCISEADAACLPQEKAIAEVAYAVENFFTTEDTHLLDIIRVFAVNDSNILPVLDRQMQYMGYYELNQIMGEFNETPFLAEAGTVIVVETGFADYSFSEMAQIIESNGARIFGAFLSRVENDVAQITIKISSAAINEILQSFRRYNYNVVSSLIDDDYLESLRERSAYLDKYLNM